MCGGQCPPGVGSFFSLGQLPVVFALALLLSVGVRTSDTVYGGLCSPRGCLTPQRRGDAGRQRAN
ncbi:hypothetical protein [Mycobacterium lentiflavum]|uniref:hypothetical protein n=1 Tax=Mycobacterium lentiflavum TaxID=141349 RepID=UPI003B84B028